MDELSRESQREEGGDAIQRYVIAYAEAERARDLVVSAVKRMQNEHLEVVRYLRHSGSLHVDLLDGSKWTIFVDSAGIVVVPRDA